jgi:galactonate dehydratase
MGSSGEARTWIEVDEVEIARHPFEQEVLHAANAVLPDGTVVDW